jgi:predicted RecA/RadA family phage recombinase
MTYYDAYDVAGREVSSTYEGRHLTFLESLLVHPSHTDSLVNKGDPVLYGNIVGVAFNSAAAATDMIAIDTEGIWALNVLGAVSDGTTDGIAKALPVGTQIYIHRTSGVLSGQSEPYWWTPFGVLLHAVGASVVTSEVAAVKVHGRNNELAQVFVGAGIGDGLLLEGDSALRMGAWMKVFLAPATLLAAGEQLHGINMRVEDTLVATGGEITAGEFKAVRNKAATLSAMTALKLDCDNKVGGIGAYARGLDIVMEGAGTAPAVRSAIHVGSYGTAGTLEGLIELDAFTVMGGNASDTLNTPSGTIGVIVAGVKHFLQLYST